MRVTEPTRYRVAVLTSFKCEPELVWKSRADQLLRLKVVERLALFTPSLTVTFNSNTPGENLSSGNELAYLICPLLSGGGSSPDVLPTGRLFCSISSVTCKGLVAPLAGHAVKK